MRPGLFVSFEGIEGCGKTTQISELSSLLNKRGIAHTVTREPGGTPVGESIRRVLLDSETARLTPEAELLLFYASRSQNIEENIRPARNRGEVVIADRFFDASVAYQGYGRGLPLDFIDSLTDRVCGDSRPDVTILLDIAPETGLLRARDRNRGQSRDEGRFEAEALDFYARVRSGYLELARREPERIRILDARGTVAELHAAVCRLLEFDRR